MPKIKLTDFAVKALQPPRKGQTTHWDNALTGFGVRVSQGGSKSFIVMHGANRRRTTLGRYPTVSLSDARTAAKRLLANQTLGKHLPASVGFDTALSEYLLEIKRRLTPRTHSDYTRLLNRHWLPTFRHSKLNDITPVEIHRKLDRMGNTLSEQTHALVALKVFLNWCVKRHYLELSPSAHIALRSKPQPRERVLTDDELIAVWNAAVGFPFGAMIRLLILTGQRRSEIGSLKWQYIKDETITLPITKNRRIHTFPVSPKVMQIIENAPQLN
ncbi:MAG: integrase family protein, partial [Alphaproteobacteria bacterium]|nr:integrase family protein [Alphaproteobacteria bacterium]